MTMIHSLLALLVPCFATPALAQQVYTSPVELLDQGPKTEGLVIQKAKLLPQPTKGTDVRSCGKQGDLWTYVKLADKCPVAVVAAVSKHSLPIANMAAANKAGAIKWTDCGKAQVDGAYRIVGQASGVTTGTCSGLVGTNLGRVGVEIRGDNAMLSDFRLIHADTPNVSPDLPEGVQIKSGNGVTIRNGYVEGFRMVHINGKYDNGDGYVVEAGVKNATLLNLESRNTSDSSFDLLKGYRIEGDNLTGRNSNRCAKIGALNVHIGHLTCSGMRNEIVAAYTAKGPPPVIDVLTYDWTRQTKPINLFAFGRGANLTIGKCIWIGKPPVGTKMMQGKPSKFTAGPGCVLP